MENSKHETLDARAQHFDHEFHHYLVFTVEGPKVTVQVVKLQQPKKKNGGKK